MLQSLPPSLLPDIARTLQQVALYQKALRNTSEGIGYRTRYRATSRVKISRRNPKAPPPVIKLLKPQALQKLKRRHEQALQAAELENAIAASRRATLTTERREEVLRQTNFDSELRAQRARDQIQQRALDH